MAAYANGLNGIQVRLEALGSTTTNFITGTMGGYYWTGGNTQLAVDVPPSPPPPCVCGEITNPLWEHSPEECTWKEDARA